ncbi:hypothetical protein [Streptomyces acidiscabies]|uniref:hypothetical protein n=1 Tax=Streptomyces acidiscabies TaxID=42234 RepID=UPI00067BD287|nr:hypothetical protein [Streptomyces acidiscabies]
MQVQQFGGVGVRLVEDGGERGEAVRDWGFINQGRNVWGRCGHTWHEPEMIRADYDAVSIPGSSSTFPTVEA